MLQSPGLPTARAKVIPLTELADAETMAVDYVRSVGVTGEGLEALKALRALSAGTHVIGLAGAIRDGQLVVEAPEAALAAGRQAMVPVGCQRPGPGIGTAGSKDELFALLGPHAEEARKLYDSKGHQTLDELKQQVLADHTMVEPSRHLANEMARAGQPAWWYRFSYGAGTQRGGFKGARHGFEIPDTFNLPAALVGADKRRTMRPWGTGKWVLGDVREDRRSEWWRPDGVAAA
jgi:para-nitrobenzyl esterase